MATIDFPGTPNGQYRTLDLNAIEVDTANLQEGVGLWENDGPTQPALELVDNPSNLGDAPLWGEKVLKAGFVTIAQRVETPDGIPLDFATDSQGLTSIRFLAEQAAPAGDVVDLGVFFRAGTVGQGSQRITIVPTPGEWQRVDFTTPLPSTADNITVQVIYDVASNPDPTPWIFYIANLCFNRDGSQEFVPNLAEPTAVDVTDPVGVTVAYTPGGTLDIGDEVTPQELVSYQRLLGSQVLTELNAGDVIRGAN